MSDVCVAAVGFLMFVQGFVLGGILYARTPFWDGVRSVYSFGRSHDR